MIAGFINAVLSENVVDIDVARARRAIARAGGELPRELLGREGQATFVKWKEAAGRAGDVELARTLMLLVPKMSSGEPVLGLEARALAELNELGRRDWWPRGLPTPLFVARSDDKLTDVFLFLPGAVPPSHGLVSLADSELTALSFVSRHSGALFSALDEKKRAMEKFLERWSAISPPLEAQRAAEYGLFQVVNAANDARRWINAVSPRDVERELERRQSERQ